MKLRIKRRHDEVDVFLLPYKDGRGWSYINITKGHICSCVFPGIKEALDDLKERSDILEWYRIGDGDGS